QTALPGKLSSNEPWIASRTVRIGRCHGSLNVACASGCSDQPPSGRRALQINLVRRSDENLATTPVMPSASAGGCRQLARADAAAGDDAGLGVGPAGIEGLARLVEVEDERCVIRGDRLALARLPIDLDRDDTAGERPGREQVIDPHPEVLVEVPGT